MAVEEFDVRLIGTADLTPTVRRFDFERTDGTPLTFVPGQFIMLHFQVGDEEVKRSYSLCHIPGRDEAAGIAVAPVEGGMATGFLWGLQIGAVCRVSGPYGRFILRPNEQPKRLILVATGTGVSPYRTMLPLYPPLVAEGTEVHVLLGVRMRDELLFGDDFAAAASEGQIVFHPCFSRADALESWERRGYVHDALQELDVNPEGDIVYLCGNPNMVDQAMDYLKERGFSPRQIRREKYI